MLNVFLTNLNKYNAGELVGEWVELPKNEAELQAIYDKISRNGQDETFITDYETDLEIKKDEFASIYKLNEFAQKLNELDETEYKIAKALLEVDYYNFDEIFDKIDWCTLYEDMDFEDLAEELLPQIYNIPPELEYYIDYEKFARDLEYSGEYTEVSGGILYIGY